MKKVLLASTALVATAGLANAEVALSGYAEIGIIGGSAAGAETQFHHDMDVKFTLSGETDGGLSFGATIDLDEVSGGISNTGNPSSVFVSGSFGTITMGDTDGAFDWALTEVASLTTLIDDHSTHAGYSGNSGLDGTYDGQVLRYDHSVGAIGFALSAEIDDAGVGDEVLGLGVKWSGDMGGTEVGVGVGYQDNGVTDIMGVSLSAGFGDLSTVLNFSTSDTGGVDTDHMAIGVTYTTGALSVHANYGEFDTAGVSSDGYGLAVNYDLGGGAVAMLGYTDSNACGTCAFNGDASWSAGLGLSF